MEEFKTAMPFMRPWYYMGRYACGMSELVLLPGPTVGWFPGTLLKIITVFFIDSSYLQNVKPTNLCAKHWSRCNSDSEDRMKYKTINKTPVLQDYEILALLSVQMKVRNSLYVGLRGRRGWLPAPVSVPER